MKTKAMKRQGWVTSTFIKEPDKMSQFEREVKKLHLSPELSEEEDLAIWIDKNLEAWVNCEKLKTWVLRKHNDRYVPERLLRAWSLSPIWEDDVLRWADSTIPALTTRPKHEPGYYSEYDDNDAWTGEPL